MRTSTVVSSVLSLALLSKEVLATPPACLLACVAKVTSASSQCNTLSNVNCVCESENSAVKSCLDEICPNGNADAAYSAFKSSCSAQNVSLGDSSSSASASSSASSTSASSSAASSSAAASSTEASSSAAASSTEASSTEASSSAAAATTSSTEAPATSSTITSVAKETSASEAPASTKSSSTHSVVTVSQGAGNLLQLGGSVAAIAAAALLI